MRVIVVGGGAVGLCTAESLSSRGAEVCVLERDRVGFGASAGNAGWVTPSLSIPVPGPGVIAASLRWLVKPSGPLWIRPTVSPAMLSWIARFVARCARPAFHRSLAALQLAAADAGPAFDRLAERGAEFELHDDPLLYPAFDRRELEHLHRVVAELRAAGARHPLDRVSPGQLVDLEPALEGGGAGGPVGGLIAHGERRVRPESLVAGVRSALRSRGVEVLERAPAATLCRGGPRWLVEGPAGERQADAVVLAGGVASVHLLEPFGVRLPVVAAKGYSRTYPRDPSGPQRPLYLERPKVSVSVFDDGVRLSGTLELGARSLTLSERRLAAITTAAQRAMPRWPIASQPRDWAGMRSLSPDGLPFIGPVPGLDGVHVATAHATLGITLAPLTGELIARLLLERDRGELHAAFDPARALTATTGGPR